MLLISLMIHIILLLLLLMLESSLPHCSNISSAVALDDYFLSRLPVVEKRLAQSGVRLAATLNRVFRSGAKIAVA